MFRYTLTGSAEIERHPSSARHDDNPAVSSLTTAWSFSCDWKAVITVCFEIIYVYSTVQKSWAPKMFYIFIYTFLFYYFFTSAFVNQY